MLKATDGFFTTFFVNPYSVHIVRFGARRGWRPNSVTVTSMLVGLLAAGAFATGERWGMVAGAILLQAAFTLDCVDGQLARYTQTFSRTGAYMDSVFDRGKEYIVYAGLAAGAARNDDPVWLLAAAALALQTVRHTIDLTLAERRARAAEGATGPPTAWTWIKRIAGFPIGERFAAISVTAAFWDAEVVFVVVLAGTTLALLYLLAGTLGRGEGAALVPAAMRAVHYGGLLALAAAGDAEDAAFALLGMLAFAHYDRVYRPAHLGRDSPPRLQLVAGAWPVHLALAAVLLAVDAIDAGYFVAAALLALGFVVSAAKPPARPAPT